MAYYPLIASGQLDAEATKIEITKDNNGEPFKLTAAVFSIEVVGTSTNTADNGGFYIRANSNTAATGSFGEAGNMIRNDASKKRAMQFEIVTGMFLCAMGFNGAAGTPMTAINSNFSTVEALYIVGKTSGNNTMGVGTRWSLYGIQEE